MPTPDALAHQILELLKDESPGKRVTAIVLALGEALPAVEHDPRVTQILSDMVATMVTASNEYKAGTNKLRGG